MTANKQAERIRDLVSKYLHGIIYWNEIVKIAEMEDLDGNDLHEAARKQAYIMRMEYADDI